MLKALIFGNAMVFHLCRWLSLAWVAKPTMIQGKCEISLGGGGGGGGEAGH